MKLNRQQEILNEIAAIHSEWEDQFEDQVPMDQSHSDPHDKETGASDYNQHHVARSASTDQEKVFQDRIAELQAELDEITSNAPGADPETVTASGEPDPEGDPATSVDFDLAVNGEIVQMLVKHDFEEGTLSYREKGVWIEILPKQETPVLDEADLVAVTGAATPIWDAKEGSELLLIDFKEVLLDLAE